MSKKKEREKRYEKQLKKNIEKAYEYPYCRMCKVELKGKWLAERKKGGDLPLCEVCYPKAIEQYKKSMELWQKFNQR